MTDVDIKNFDVGLEFTRTYNSLSLHDYAGTDGYVVSNYGNGWTNSFDAHLEVSATSPNYGDAAAVYDTDGTRYDYVANAQGVFVPPPGVHATLSYLGNELWGWQKTDGTLLVFYTPVYFQFDPAQAALTGRLAAIYGRNQNNYLTFSYSFDGNDASAQTKLNQITVTTQANQSLTLRFQDFNGSRLLASVQRPGGQMIGYSYDANQNLTSADEPPNTMYTNSCPSGQISACLPVTYYWTGGYSHLLYAAAGPRWFASGGSAGGYDYFVYNGNIYGTSDPVLQRGTAGGAYVGTMNFTPSDGTNTPINSSSPTGPIQFYAYWIEQNATKPSEVPPTTVTYGDVDGHSLAYAYDNSDRITGTTVGTGSQTLYEGQVWDSNNNLAESSDYAGYVSDYAYDTNGNLIARAGPATTTSEGTFRPTELISYGVDQNGVTHNNPIAVCDPHVTNSAAVNGNWTSPPAQSDSLCKSVPGARQYYWSATTSEPFGELSSMTDASGYTTQFSYPTGSQVDHGLPVTVAGAPFQEPSQDGSTTVTLSPTVSYSYDSAGNVLTENNGIGTRSYTYDSQGLGWLTSTTDEDGVTTDRRTYTPDGNVATEQTAAQAAAGVSVTDTYDGDDHLLTEANFNGCVSANPCTSGITQNVYDGGGRLVEVILPHDPADYVSQPWMTRYLYDLSQGGTITMAPGVTGMAHGNLYGKQLYYAPGQSSIGWQTTSGTTYDALDRDLNSYDFASAYVSTPRRSNVYDSVITAYNNCGLYSGRAGKLTSSTNGAGQGTEYQYDSSGQLAGSEGDSTRTTFCYARDADGRITSDVQNGATETIGYDAEGRVTSDTTPAYGVESSSTLKTITYYANGLRSGLGLNTGNGRVNAGSLFTYSYRTDGLLASQVLALGGSHRFTYNYTNAGRPSQMADPATGYALPNAVARRPEGGGFTGIAPERSVSKAQKLSTSETQELDSLGLKLPAKAVLYTPARIGITGGTREKSDETSASPRATIRKPSLAAFAETFIAPKQQGRATLSARRGVSGNANAPMRILSVPQQRVRTLSGGGTYSPTTFTYDNAGQLQSETLPSGGAYTSITHDLEGEVTQYSAFGGLQVVNSYSTRGELIGEHYYQNGSLTTAWPHFSESPSLGYMIPTSEDVPDNSYLLTAYYQGDDLSYTSKQFASNGSLVGGFGWGIDAVGRQNQDRFADAYGDLGVVSRGYDSRDNLTQWAVLTTDPISKTPVTGWPNPQSNRPAACNAGISSAPSLLPPGTTINYQFDPSGRVDAETLIKPGLPSTYAQVHWDAGAPLFTTDSNGHVDFVRVGQQAVVAPNGQTEMLDRDWRGAWVQAHTNTGYSVWSPVDPNLQDCAPANPPAGAGSFSPVTVQFAQLSPDTVTDGINFFGGVRSYDPAANQWTSLDGSSGSAEDPVSQLTYRRDRNNVNLFEDPTGLYAVTLPPLIGPVPVVPTVPWILIAGRTVVGGVYLLPFMILKGGGIPLPSCYGVCDYPGLNLRAPGQPTEKDGFKPKKNWDGRKVKNPNGPGYGFPDENGDVWVPTGEGPGTDGHGGPHWDVEEPDGGYRNVYPGGKVR